LNNIQSIHFIHNDSIILIKLAKASTLIGVAHIDQLLISVKYLLGTLIKLLRFEGKLRNTLQREWRPTFKSHYFSKKAMYCKMISFSSSKVLLSGYWRLNPSSTSFTLIMKKFRTSLHSLPTCPVSATSRKNYLNSLRSSFSRGLASRLKDESFPPFSMILI